MPRDITIKARLTAEEMAAVSASAEKAGMTVSAFIRARVLKSALPQAAIERHDLYRLGIVLRADPAAAEALDLLRELLERL